MTVDRKNVKVETIYRRHSADSRATFEVTDIPSHHMFIVTTYFIGYEISYRYFDYRFEDIRPRSLAMDQAIARCMGQRDLYDEMVEAGLVDDMIDFGDKLFEE